jgi:hypothetical protein
MHEIACFATGPHRLERATKLVMRWLARVITVAALSFAAGAGGCTSPTLPLPPPTAPTITTGSEPSTFHLKSDKGAIPNALIVVVNRNEAVPRDQRVEGTIADAFGSWELDIKATSGDFVDISQEDGTTRSPVTTVQLR